MRRTNHGQQQLTLDAAPERGPAGASSQPSTTTAAQPIVILRLPEVCRITGLCRSLVYELEANGAFPRRVPLGARSVGWVEGEIQSWLAARVKAREPGTTTRSTRTADNRTIGPLARRTRGDTASTRAFS